MLGEFILSNDITGMRSFSGISKFELVSVSKNKIKSGQYVTEIDYSNGFLMLNNTF